MNMTSLVLATAQGRYDLYGPIHKGLRRAHGIMLSRLGAADYAEGVSDLLTDLRTHLALAETHLKDEETYIHEALRARAPSGTDRLEKQHADHRSSFAMIELAIRAVEGASGAAEAIASGRQLYLSFSRFVAEDLEHMAEEECETWPLLCTLFTDAELQALEMAIVGSLDPATNLAFLRHVMPATSHCERAAMLNGMKAEMPPHAYAAVIEQAVLPDLGLRAGATRGDGAVGMTALTFRNPSGLYDPTPFGYSQLAQVTAGLDLLLVAGQGGIAPDMSMPPDFRSQLRQAIANVEIALASAGAPLTDVARTMLLIVDYDAEKFGILTEELARAWPDGKPASTLIPVPCLALPGMLVEIEATAVVGNAVRVNSDGNSDT